MKISVLIPSYNRAHLLPRAIESALQQTHKPHEIIVVDDGSSDATAEVAKKYHGAISYHYQKNAGVSAARNRGLEIATGDCVCLLDSDDWIEPTWLEQANEIMMMNQSISAVCANIIFETEHGEVIEKSNFRRLSFEGFINIEELFLHRIGLGSNLCVRLSLAKSIGGFNTNIDTAEDIDFALRLAALTSIHLITKPLIHVIRSNSSLSSRINTGNRLRVFDKFEKDYPDLSQRYSAKLNVARKQAALDYAYDLTEARNLPEARKMALLAWRFGRSWVIAKQLLKIEILTLLSKRKKRQ